MATRELSAWSADGKPNWSDIAVAAFATLWAVSYLFLIETVSWLWLAVGFIVGAILMGPVAISQVGELIGSWLESIGVAGRAVSIIASVVGLGAVEIALGIPQTPMTNATIGGMFAFGVFVVTEALRAKNSN